VVTFFSLAGFATLDEFNDAGTMGAFGFCGAYALICIAAPLYLKKIGQLGAKEIGLSLAGLGLLCIPAVGSVYPVPPAPVNYFPYVFGCYLIIGLFRAVAYKVRDPKSLAQIREELSEMRMPGGLAYK
jgi:hypothetical protein